jgi:hypothetical protein
MDADTDTDGDTDYVCNEYPDTDTDDNCDGYPAGPYAWDVDSVLTPVRFPAIYSSGGAVAELDLCNIFNNRDAVKTFIIGAAAED